MPDSTNFGATRLAERPKLLGGGWDVARCGVSNEQLAPDIFLVLRAARNIDEVINPIRSTSAKNSSANFPSSVNS